MGDRYPYVLNKSLNDFFALSNYVSSTYGKKAPKLNTEIFKHRLMKGDQSRVMTKSLKIFESYLKKLGKNKLYWDDRVLEFLDVTERHKVNKLKGKHFTIKIDGVEVTQPRASGGF